MVEREARVIIDFLVESEDEPSETDMEAVLATILEGLVLDNEYTYNGKTFTVGFDSEEAEYLD